ncbi:MAG: hypothetical protein F4X44_08260 [Gammaproteobacteria bacterium]|nr:hypothetical protein [Gammaproteobacteria bacterium]MYD80590.1 hypothetical protein [Gammaproteobacteria bacterium]
MDSPVEAWKFWNWFLFLVLFIPLVNRGIDLAILSLVVVISLLLLGLSYGLRRQLASMCIPKSELDAYSKGLGRSLAAAAPIAFFACVIVFFAVEAFAEHLGVWDKIDDWESHFIVQYGILLTVLSLFGLIGWLLWGREGYRKHIHRLKMSESH